MLLSSGLVQSDLDEQECNSKTNPEHIYGFGVKNILTGQSNFLENHTLKTCFANTLPVKGNSKHEFKQVDISRSQIIFHFCIVRRKFRSF